MLTVFFICFAIGALAGFLAGLLGIGGGLVVVPVLSVVLHQLDIVAPQSAFLVAVATSLASIIFTSFSSAYSHHRHGNIDWPLAGWIIVGVTVGAALSSSMAGWFSVRALKMIFSMTLIFVALRMVFSASAATDPMAPRPSKWIVVPLGTVIAALASLIGIGGGALIVPMLTQLHFDVRKSIGVAAVGGTCIALVASIGYILTGWQQYALSDWFLGYIYLPALAGIISTSTLFAPLGVKVVHRLPIKVIRRLFSAFLLMVAIKVLLE
jgi:uncharacterized membrane protein YfcA